MGGIFNLANAVTLFRIIVLAPLSVYFIVVGNPVAVLAVVAAFFVLDKVDGWIARKYNQITETGRMLDGFADTIGLLIILAYFYLNTVLSLWESFVVIFPRILTDMSAFFIKLAKGRMIKTYMLKFNLIVWLALFLTLFFTGRNIYAVILFCYVVLYASTALHIAITFRSLYFKTHSKMITK